jgi:hypothetical protein
VTILRISQGHQLILYEEIEFVIEVVELLQHPFAVIRIGSGKQFPHHFGHQFLVLVLEGLEGLRAGFPELPVSFLELAELSQGVL